MMHSYASRFFKYVRPSSNRSIMKRDTIVGTPRTHVRTRAELPEASNTYEPIISPRPTSSSAKETDLTQIMARETARFLLFVNPLKVMSVNGVK